MNKCKHGVYDPHGDGAYCQSCNPATNDAVGNERAIPQFGRRSAQITETGKLPRCSNCQGILATSNGGKCSICHTEHDLIGPTKLRANNHQSGTCPGCASSIHFVVNAKTWKCADCGQDYKAPKRIL